MLKLVAVVYIGILVAVFSIGMLIGNEGGSSSSGAVVPIHGHVHEQLYEIIVPDELLEMFITEEGYFSCDSIQLCHIEGEMNHEEHDE